ncbi:MAG: hypothetical protein VB035_03230 [Candidatus Fimivivens sp.]|nr:hypothetical protein [Candidatus Fimivivens sp.]
MSATYMHVGIPVTNKKPGMVHNEDAHIWMSNPEDYDYKIEYLVFEDGTPFPEEIHREIHVAYKVDNMQKYLDEADRIICGPMPAGETAQIAFIRKDGAIIELYQEI